MSTRNSRADQTGIRSATKSRLKTKLTSKKRSPWQQTPFATGNTRSNSTSRFPATTAKVLSAAAAASKNAPRKRRIGLRPARERDIQLGLAPIAADMFRPNSLSLNRIGTTDCSKRCRFRVSLNPWPRCTTRRCNWRTDSSNHTVAWRTTRRRRTGCSGVTLPPPMRRSFISHFTARPVK